MRPRARQVNFDVTDITDPLIRINSGQTGANDKDIGIVFERGSDTNVAVIWDESADELVVVNTNEIGSTNGNVTINSYANIRANTFTAENLTLSGTLTINGTALSLTHNENSNPYVVTDSDNTNNTGNPISITASTLGFDLTGAVSYTIFLNRLYLRSSEVSVNTSNGTITFAADVLDAVDEIDAVWLK